MKKSAHKVIEIVKEKRAVFLISFSFFIFISIFLNKTGLMFNGILSFYGPIILFLFVLLNFLVVPSLVGIVFSMSVYKFQEIGKIHGKSGFFGVLGAIIGIFGGTCPLCFAGVFPLILGLFGITLTLSVLPLSGFEFGIFSAGLLIFAIFYLSKDITCKIK